MALGELLVPEEAKDLIHSSCHDKPHYSPNKTFTALVIYHGPGPGTFLACCIWGLQCVFYSYFLNYGVSADTVPRHCPSPKRYC